jgi:HEAT repeat protein
MKLTLLALVAAGAGAYAAPHVVPAAAPVAPAPYEIVAGSTVPTSSWAPLDTADSLWRRGRIAISEEDWSRAADTFERLHDRHPQSAYAGDALYWQAFALQRLGGRSDLRRAVTALQTQKEQYPKAATYESGESSALLTRLNGRLARAGDAEAAAAISEIATGAAMIGVSVAEQVLPEVARELERARPEIERGLAAGLAGARAGLAEAGASLAGARAGMGRGRGDEIPAECEGVIGEDQVEALNALLQMGSDQALPILKRVLERRDRCSEVLRRKAVFLVSQKRSEEAVDILVNTAKTDPDTETRKQAVFWLSQTRSDRAVEVLEQILLKDAPDQELQEQALFSISQHRSARAQRILRDVAQRRDAPAKMREDAIFWLGQRPDGESSEFLRGLFPSLENDELREKVLFSVAQSKSAENSRWLLERAKDRRLDASLRKSALFWAGQSGVSIKDVAEIYDTAGDDRELRNQVIFVLSQRRRDEAAMDKLVDIAQRERDPELRRQAIFWLGQSNDPRAAKLLEDIINKPR